jgi:uncharacterized protein YjbJ (UPF0337 family)
MRSAIPGREEVDMGELIEKAKGKIKQMFGAMSGNRRTQAEGIVEEKKGDLKSKLEEVKQDIKRPPR